MTLTFGSELKIPTTTTSVGAAPWNRAVGLTDVLGIAVFSDNDGDAVTDLHTVLIDASALTLTKNTGSDIQLLTAPDTTSPYSAMCRMSDTVALYIHKVRVNASPVTFDIDWYVLTENSGAIQVATGTLYEEDYSSDTDVIVYFSVVSLTATKAIFLYWEYDATLDLYRLQAEVLTISGSGTGATVSSGGSAVTLYTSSDTYTTDPTATAWPIVRASNAAAVCMYAEIPNSADADGFYEMNARVLSAPGTTITMGSAYLISDIDANNGASTDTGALARLADDTIVSYIELATAFAGEAFQILTLTGTAISIGTASDPIAAAADGVLAVGFESDLMLMYDDRTTDNCYEFSSIGATVPTETDSAEWTPTIRPFMMTPLVGAATPTLLTAGNTTSGATGHLYVRAWRSSVTPTPPAASASHIWLTADGGLTWANIGDSSWTTEIVGAVAVQPNTALQTIYAMVGTYLWMTTNGGTTWGQLIDVGYESDTLQLLPSGNEVAGAAPVDWSVFVANRAAAGNRASVVYNLATTPAVTHINTSKSTTGGATSSGKTG